MTKPTKKNLSESGVFEAEFGTTYTLDVVARLSGVDSDTIVHYREHGLITSVRKNDPDHFDAEAVRLLRRIEHLRTTHALNLPALKFVLGLVNELEQLQAELRSRSLR